MAKTPVVAALLLLCGAAARASGAEAPDDPHQRKVEFVAALRQFAESAGGSYGDEGPRLPSALDAAQRALESWDHSIAIVESTARSAPGDADARAALGSIYLDRARIQEALKELAAAA